MTAPVDITPTARVLRTLGEIPFELWQCVAELVDNSLDAFANARNSSIQLKEERIIVSWSNSNVPEKDSVVEVLDTGPGMDLETMRDCVRAGYTTNDPISTLGLFGMGFNIATARLGDKTIIYSSKAGAAEWIGIEIDFTSLIRQGSFNAPVVTQPKREATKQGTRIVVSRLKPGTLSQMRNQEGRIRRMLERVYTPLLASSDIEVRIQGKVLKPKPHCVWNPERYVSSRSGSATPARIDIEEDCGESLFNVPLNRYLTPEEETEVRSATGEGGQLPEGIVTRRRRVRGWLGVQRYADPDDYGIDFIRNDRKILLSDKSLFYFENPLTGTREIEYPVELGNTVGGRLVGEIHIDHVPPNYQKTDFDRTDQSWREMVELLRGAGPILQKKRKLLGFTDENRSALANLVSAYRRVDQGTRHLMAPNQPSKEWAKRFVAGETECQDDDKWWKAAQEVDRARADKGAETAGVVDIGLKVSDDVGRYGPGESGGAGAATVTDTEMEVPAEVSVVEELKQRSRQALSLSGEYQYSPTTPPLKVRVWEIIGGEIGSGEPGLACQLVSEGIECDFFFNPRHPFLASYPISPWELLLVYLADRFKARDNITDIAEVFVGLTTNKFQGERVDPAVILEKAQAIFDTLRDRSVTVLSAREQEVIDFVHESAGEVEEIMSGLMSNPELMAKFQKREIGSIDSIALAPAKTIVRLVERFPEEFFDGKVFLTPYVTINLQDLKATERLRTESKDRLLSFLKDGLWALTESQKPSSPQRRKGELIRCAHSIEFLNQGLC